MSLQKEITLKDLCGFHLLQGFELTKQKVDRYRIADECDVVKFTLDGVTYIAVEDPDDGYRSYCDGIKISEEKPVYSIPNCEVICKMKPDGCFDEHDVLIGVDAHTGLVVFEIGTLYVNDYYPYCHFEYHPENMYCNRNADELYEQFINKFCNRNCDESVRGETCDRCGVLRAINMIKSAPTIIEAENSSAIDDDVKKYCDYLKSETYDFCNQIENGEVSE